MLIPGHLNVQNFSKNKLGAASISDRKRESIGERTDSLSLVGQIDSLDGEALGSDGNGGGVLADEVNSDSEGGGEERFGSEVDFTPVNRETAASGTVASSQSHEVVEFNVSSDDIVADTFSLESDGPGEFVKSCVVVGINIHINKHWEFTLVESPKSRVPSEGHRVRITGDRSTSVVSGVRFEFALFSVGVPVPALG